MSGMANNTPIPPRDSQAEVVRFLKSPEAHGGAAPDTVVETHGALVFLAGEVALKIKRAVRYDYMDLSTRTLRKEMLLRELVLNRKTAPRIYHDVVPITRAPDGRLALNGPGTPVEWVLRMWRFPAGDELSVIAERGDFTDRLADDLGHRIFAYHRAAPRREADGATLIRDILDELARVFAGMQADLGAADIASFDARARAALGAATPLLARRSAAGHVRRCHGDLHLRNLVLLDGVPTPFDALEFSETLGTCDVLYDLAFLIMDLRHRSLCGAANIVLNSYLLAAAGSEDAGLAALPLFIAVRAAIRAMVAVQTLRASTPPASADTDAHRYLNEALAALAPARPRLVAVGGLSGTGKTTLARPLAPQFGAVPGAVHLRSDLERKAMAGRPAQTRLSAAQYAKTARDRIYGRMLERAETLLCAGHSVLLDATFIDPAHRAAAAALADRLGLSFTGLWLEGPASTLLARVGARSGDASDADAAVVQAQLALDPGPIDWHRLACGGAAETVLGAALTVLRARG
jgi:hypothetical protein